MCLSVSVLVVRRLLSTAASSSSSVVRGHPLESLISVCKRRGFVHASGEQFNGLSGAFDYGPLGVQLKRNISDAWWRAFVDHRSDVEGVDTPVLLHPRVWQLAGHVEHFADAQVECRHCHTVQRADHVVGDAADTLDDAALAAHFQTHAATLACLSCGKRDAFRSAPVRRNLMLQTHVGAAPPGGTATYLRPETAQGVFATAKHTLHVLRAQAPFGLAQIGRAFRNEINPAHFLFRMREFEQCELEYFCTEADVANQLQYWIGFTERFLVAQLGLPAARLRKRPHRTADDVRDTDDDTFVTSAHYARRGGADVEFQFSFGWSELCGIANRGTFDTERHNIVGDDGALLHVVEPSLGLDRMVLAVLDACWLPRLSKPELQGVVADPSGDAALVRDVLTLPHHLAPYKFAVLPLRRRDDMLDLSRSLHRRLLTHARADIDVSASIGKRYRRQDEIGTPICVTIDEQSMTDATVTLRDRDSAKQMRLSVEQLMDRLKAGERTFFATAAAAEQKS
jgi:glycyl-tRNA synthetase